ncbi:MAG: hypothetical protein H0T79_06940 [Deltaproteobacteria bacterium]|nr:hypothetical protein [Deltaproteobacteria bacterium]
MAKTESTAVNALIDLVNTQKPLPADPSEDLMFAAPRKGSGRVASTELLGAREVEPLPRGRVGLGTQTNLSPAQPGVRMSSQPVRAMTIPPLSTRPSGALPVQGMASRETKPTLPPPIRSRSQGTPAPELSSTSMRSASTPTPSHPVPPASRSLVHATVAPASMPVAAPFEPARVAPATLEPARVAPATLDMTSNQPWFDSATTDAIEAELSESHSEGTLQLQKTTGTLGLVGKLIMPMLLLVIAGIFVGGFIAFDGDGGKKSRSTQAAATPVAIASPDSVAAAAPIAAVAVEGTQAEPAVKADDVKPAEVITPAPIAAVPPPAPVGPLPGSAPALVDVRIDSKPSGATVMLVDRGKTTFLGTTPISTAVDPSRTYDIVFTYEDRPTQLEHLDATATTHLAVVLGKAGNAAPPATKPVVTAVVAAKPVGVAKAAPMTAAVPKAPVVAKPVAKVEPKRVETAVAAPAVKKPAAGGAGVLMISSKPPCEIHVDGKPTGLMTPQRAISLAAGAHNITLVSPDKAIKRTFAVQIAADKPTKVIQDLMKP